MRTIRTAIAACLALLLCGAATASPILPPEPTLPPDVSVVGLPAYAQPKTTLAFSVAVHRDDARAGIIDVALASDGMTIDSITPSNGICDGMKCHVFVQRDAPAAIWVRGHFRNECVPAAHLSAHAYVPQAPVHPSIVHPPATPHATIINETPVCRVYIPLASQQAP